ncbi:hypothetical protein OSB04_001119 [Centaurea solstitialis]|uniref:Uncharacterized protein n=1 Tax=Centaurea solstitialis TaxID=347529 RepID=A0AA38TQE4_9ASTR|nr:hypothetical protein OSB04_001119 [Centaurea solstitialis]
MHKDGKWLAVDPFQMLLWSTLVTNSRVNYDFCCSESQPTDHAQAHLQPQEPKPYAAPENPIRRASTRPPSGSITTPKPRLPRFQSETHCKIGVDLEEIGESTKEMEVMELGLRRWTTRSGYNGGWSNKRPSRSAEPENGNRSNWKPQGRKKQFLNQRNKIRYKHQTTSTKIVNLALSSADGLGRASLRMWRASFQRASNVGSNAKHINLRKSDEQSLPLISRGGFKCEPLFGCEHEDNRERYKWRMTRRHVRSMVDD